MVRVIVTPRQGENLYGMLLKKELSLRKNNRGTLHASGKKKRNEEKWVHNNYPGWIRFQKCLGGVLVAQVSSRAEGGEWQLLSSFIGFLDRHFRKHITDISIKYDGD